MWHFLHSSCNDFFDDLVLWNPLPWLELQGLVCEYGIAPREGNWWTSSKRCILPVKSTDVTCFGYIIRSCKLCKNRQCILLVCINQFLSNNYPILSSRELNWRRDLMIPSPAYLWRRKPQLGWKNVALLSAYQSMCSQAYKGQRTLNLLQINLSLRFTRKLNVLHYSMSPILPSSLLPHRHSALSHCAVNITEWSKCPQRPSPLAMSAWQCCSEEVTLISSAHNAQLPTPERLGLRIWYV